MDQRRRPAPARARRRHQRRRACLQRHHRAQARRKGTAQFAGALYESLVALVAAEHLPQGPRRPRHLRQSPLLREPETPLVRAAGQDRFRPVSARDGDANMSATIRHSCRPARRSTPSRSITFPTAIVCMFTSSRRRSPTPRTKSSACRGSSGMSPQEVLAHEAVANSEKRYRQLTEATMDGIVVIDPDGAHRPLQSGGRAHVRLCRRGSARARRRSILVPEEFRELHGEGVASYLRTRLPELLGRPQEFKGKRKDGSDFPVEIALSLLTDPGDGNEPTTSRRRKSWRPSAISPSATRCAPCWCKTRSSPRSAFFRGGRPRDQ